VKKTRMPSRQQAFEVSIVWVLFLTSCGSACDSGDGKGGNCEPCNDNRVCDPGLTCSGFTGGKELCGKPSTTSCTTASGNGEQKSILSTLKIPENQRGFALDLATK
jgi:hypothetical protein